MERVMREVEEKHNLLSFVSKKYEFEIRYWVFWYLFKIIMRLFDIDRNYFLWKYGTLHQWWRCWEDYYYYIKVVSSSQEQRLSLL